MKYPISIRFLVILFIIICISCNYNNNQYESDITDLRGGEYIQLVYIGSASCVYCSDMLHDEIKITRNLLRKWAHENNYKFISTGVSVDLDADEGFLFLKKSGPYDEIITGASWYNLGASHYIWKRNEVEAFTPQIKILKSHFQVAGSPFGNILKIIRDEILIDDMHELEELIEFNRSFDEVSISMSLLIED